MSNFFDALSPEGAIWLTIGIILDAFCLAATALWIPGGLVADIICLIIVGLWMYFRSGSTPEMPERTKMEARTGVKTGVKTAEKTAGKTAGRTAVKTAGKTAGRSVGKKILIRGGIAFLGTLIGAATILIQFVPFWFITIYWELTHD